MKKGFTLVELLAAIVVLSIVLLITVPKVTDTINESKKQSYIASAKKIIEASQMYTIDSLDFNAVDVLDSTKIDLESGQKPNSGTVQTNNKQETRIAVVYDNYCITKSYTETDLTVDNNTSSCNLR